ncbi:RNA polymerase sigma factor [Streptomyces sp. NPDC055912]|uniref:RNA polymerase sigma factor n=1 Tax=Streptomyces sp. NPDC055912 TaxID=3345660 RepID=UPI0035D94134
MSNAEGPSMESWSGPPLTCPICQNAYCSYLGRPYAAFSAEIEATYREYYSPLLNFIGRQARKYDIAESQVDQEGVVQYAFELAIRHWGDLRDPRAWLFTVADRVLKRNAFNRRTRQSWYELHHDVERYEESRWSTFTSRANAGQILSAAGAFEAMADLPERQRVATYLHHVHGLTQAEIADLLGCKPSTVGVHIHRGVEKIREDPRLHVASPGARGQSRPPETLRRVLRPDLLQGSGLKLAAVGLSGIFLGGVLFRWKPPVWAATLTAATAAAAAPPVRQAWKAHLGRRDDHGTRKGHTTAPSVAPSPAVPHVEQEPAELFHPGTGAGDPGDLKPPTLLEESYPLPVEPEPSLDFTEHDVEPEPEPPTSCANCTGGWWRSNEEVGCWCGRYVPVSIPDQDAEEIQNDEDGAPGSSVMPAPN